jgi:hypothetical protein
MTTAFVPGYRNDVFVSYAHVDNEPLPGAKLGWVSNLVGALKIELASTLGRAEILTVWQDLQLQGNADITSDILAAVDDAATLVLILSPGYLASEWCQRERNRFLAKARGLSRRVFLVEITQVEREDRPAELKELKGYPFWVREVGGKAPRTLGKPQPLPEERSYYDRVGELAYELASQLKALKAGGTPTVAKPVDRPTAGPTVFLAEATDDLDDHRSTLRRYLQQAGAEVLPSRDLPHDPAELRAALCEQLARSRLFVQLVGPVVGKRSPELPHGRPRFQYECARAIGLPILQWRSPALDLRDDSLDPQQRDFLMLGTVHAQTLVAFSQAVLTAANRRTAQEAAPDELRRVFIDIKLEDRKEASRLLERVLKEVPLAKATYAWPELDPRAWRRMVEEADGVLIVWSADGNWAAMRWLECHKRRSNRKRAATSLAIYDGPPEDKPPELPLAGPPVQVIHGRRGSPATELVTFVSTLR